MGKLHVRLPLWSGRVFAGLETQYVSSILSTQTGTIGGYWLNNLTLFSEALVPGMDASVSAYNLLDKRYSQTSSEEYLQRSIPQDGRTFMMELTYRFR